MMRGSLQARWRDWVSSPGNPVLPTGYLGTIDEATCIMAQQASGPQSPVHMDIGQWLGYGEQVLPGDGPQKLMGRAGSKVGLCSEHASMSLSRRAVCGRAVI